MRSWRGALATAAAPSRRAAGIAAALAWRELQAGLRARAFLVGALGCSVAAAIWCSRPPASAALAGYETAWLGRVVVAIYGVLMFANLAVRDRWAGAVEIVDSKPVRASILALARFAGNLAVLWVLLTVQTVAGLVAASIASGHIARPIAIWDVWARSGTGVFYLCAMAYTLSMAFGSRLAAWVAALYWLLVLLGRDYLPRIFNFTLTQNAAVYLPVAVGLLWLTGLIMDRRHRGVWPTGPGMAWSILLIALGPTWGAAFVVARHDPPFHYDLMAQAVASQHELVGERAPGFALPEARGGTVQLHDFPNQRLVILVWSPHVPQSVVALETLARTRASWEEPDVQLVAVCIDEDWATARDAVREGDFAFPMAYDPDAVYVHPPRDGSPVAEAYDCASLPHVTVTDGRRTVADVTQGQAELLDAWVRVALRKAQEGPK